MIKKWSFVLCLLILSGVNAQANEQWARWLTPEIVEYNVLGDFNSTYFTTEEIEDQNQSFGMMEHDASVAAPLIQTEKIEWDVTLSARILDLDTQAVLPDSDRKLPDDLASLIGGTTFRMILDNGWMFGVNGRFGSASNKLFESSDELVWGSTAFLKIPHGEHNAFIIYCDYDNNHVNYRAAKYPLPGIGYQVALAENAWAIVGFPASALHWAPTKNFAIDAFYVLPRSLNAKATYTWREKLDVYGAFDWESQRYLRTNREDKDDGLIMYDKRLTVGTNYRFNKHVELGVRGGYAFDRFIFEGQEYDENDVNRIDIGNGMFVGLNLDIDF